MHSTREVLDRIRAANPGRSVTEDRIRHALRRGLVSWPRVFSGRLLWTEADVDGLCEALGFERPGCPSRDRNELRAEADQASARSGPGSSPSKPFQARPVGPGEEQATAEERLPSWLDAEHPDDSEQLL